MNNYHNSRHAGLPSHNTSIPPVLHSFSEGGSDSAICHLLSAIVPVPKSFSLRRDLGIWELSQGSRRAILKHELGLDYVAYLLDHPDQEIHGLALGLKVRAVRNGEPMESAEVIQERALALDDIDAARRLYRKQRELEGIIDDELTVEAVRDEAYAQLKDILAYQKKHIARTSSQADKASHAVGTAINRLYTKLARACDHSGQPHTLLRDFALTIKRHILEPSGRGKDGGSRRKASGGHFIYVTRIDSETAR
jgi:hypothetical protein